MRRSGGALFARSTWIWWGYLAWLLALLAAGAASLTIAQTPAGAAGCGSPATAISLLQGDGAVSPAAGEPHTVEGVVVGDFQRTADTNFLRGFFLQEEPEQADGEPATSDGIFVFDDRRGVDVRPGDVVRVSGTVEERFGQTQLAQVTELAVCARNGDIAPTPVELPFPDVDYPERYEGMLVVFPQELTVGENYNLARFGEVALSFGRLYQPTHQTDPGPAAVEQRATNLRNRILLDDGQTIQNPPLVAFPPPGLSAANSLRAGATVSDLTGVLSYGFEQYRVHPTQAPRFIATNPRPTEPPDVGGNLRVASANVLNYFNGDGAGGGFPSPRGADSAEELARQQAKLVSMLAALDADVIGLMEIENDGYGPASAIQSLAGALSTVDAGAYAAVNPGVERIGADEIAVGLLYRPASVAPVGPARILDSSVDPVYRDDKNRPALAQTFADRTTGTRFTVVVNHFKSKGSPCDDIGDPDVGDGQGNCNQTRTVAAEAQARWLAGDPTGSGTANILIIGDLNAYAREDPIRALNAAGYVDLIAQFGGAEAYSYVFDGQAGYLDHALASGDLLPAVTGAAEWHVNADEPRALDYNSEFKTAAQVESFYDPGPYRASDHDPLLVGLQFAHGRGTPPPDAGVPLPDTSAGATAALIGGGMCCAWLAVRTWRLRRACRLRPHR